MQIRHFALVAQAILLSISWTLEAHATWVYEGNYLSSVPGTYPQAVADGVGGAIITWSDGFTTVHAQRVDKTGNKLWGPDGVPVCLAAGQRDQPLVVSDGVEGAIITWRDNRLGSQIYAQRIDASGNAVWKVDGIGVCANTNGQQFPSIIADGIGGAIIAWVDSRNYPASYAVYAQRIDGNGKSQWLEQGVLVQENVGIYFDDGDTWEFVWPVLVSDGFEGAIATWTQYPSNFGNIPGDIYAQRVSASGGLLWGAGGVVICDAPESQHRARIVSDGNSGAIIVWGDRRHQTNARDIYAQRVDANGQPTWTSQGVEVCTQLADKGMPEIAVDGAGGAMVAYRRSSQMLLARVDGSGNLTWGACGIAIDAGIGMSDFQSITSDGAGGAIVAWEQDIYARNDIYVNRINALGQGMWLAGPVPACSVIDAQYFPTVVSDGAKGAIVAWEDYRSDYWDATTIYAQHIDEVGNVEKDVLPVIYPEDDLDIGRRSLRWAIEFANATPGPQLITFSMHALGSHTISLNSPLPPITDVLTIDGFTQPGTSPNTIPAGEGNGLNSTLEITLDASLLTSSDNTLHASAPNCVIRGLNFTGHSGNAIRIAGLGGRVEGCYIGTSLDGMSAPYFLTGTGIYAQRGCSIGGPDPEDRNLISGNDTGITMNAAGEVVHVLGNIVGLNAEGSSRLENKVGIFAQAIVDIGNGAASGRNVVSGNQVCGIFLEGGAVANVRGNYIGTSVAGTEPLGNFEGIVVSTNDNAGASVLISENVIGGHATYELTGIYASGVRVEEGTCQVFANQIGVGPDGTTPIVNDIGIRCSETGAADIGDGTAAHANTIEFCGFGVETDPPATPTGPFRQRLLRNLLFNNANDYYVAGPLPKPFPTAPEIRSVFSTPGATEVEVECVPTEKDVELILEFYETDVQYLPFSARHYVGAVPFTSSTTDPISIMATLGPSTPGWFLRGVLVDTRFTSQESIGALIANTPEGANVSVTPVDPSSGTSPIVVTFDTVHRPGATTLEINAVGPPLPGDFQAGDDNFYHLNTTAQVGDPITVCITYDESSLAVPEASLRLMHYTSAWEDITSTLDTDANVICGITSRLSPFVIGASTATAIGDGTSPTEFALHANIPNPFNPQTMIFYDVTVGGADVSIVIYDVSGRRVRTLVDDHRPAGTWSVQWNGVDDRGQRVASGVYFYRMRAGSFVDTRKMVLLK